MASAGAAAAGSRNGRRNTSPPREQLSFVAVAPGRAMSLEDSMGARRTGAVGFRPLTSSDNLDAARVPPRRVLTHASTMPSLDRAFTSRNNGMDAVRGMYLVKFAVTTTAAYLAIHLLITFSEVLLPFIFAMILMMILEPVKKFLMRILTGITVIVLQLMPGGQSCLDMRAFDAQRHRMDSSDDYHYGGLPEDSAAEEGAIVHTVTGTGRIAVPTASIQRLNLAISIICCLVGTGRCLWLVLRVMIHSGQTVSNNLSVYQDGAYRLKSYGQRYIKDMHMEHLDWTAVIDEVMLGLNYLASAATESITDAIFQAGVAMIFLLYLLWSPVKMESNSITQDVFKSAYRYLQVKCIISAFTGTCVFVSLWMIGLELPQAFGLLTFLLKFLPGIGDIAASLLPCILGIFDVRKTPGQLLLALVCQLVINFGVYLFIEPVFFGLSVEIHSVVVILGVAFFAKVWGIPGMLLSVPLLAIARLLLKSLKTANESQQMGGDDADTISMLDNLLQGKWMMSIAGSYVDHEDYEYTDSIEHVEDGGLPAKVPIAGLDDMRPSNSVWTCMTESRICLPIGQFYMRHRLLIDIIVLIVFSTVLWMPLQFL